jgi:hypothetical protein
MKTMTDNQIEKIIWDELRKKKITLYDMIGGEYIDPDPKDKTTLSNHRARRNRFSELFSEDRMKELLCFSEYNQYNDMPLLKVDFQDLFRFWWNRCISKELFADEVLGEIFEYFANQMKPENESDQMDVALDFKQLSLTVKSQKQAA